MIGSSVPERIFKRVANALRPFFEAHFPVEVLERVHASTASAMEQDRAREVVMGALREDRNARQVVQEVIREENLLPPGQAVEAALAAAWDEADAESHAPWSAAHKVFRERSCPGVAFGCHLHQRFRSDFSLRRTGSN